MKNKGFVMLPVMIITAAVAIIVAGASMTEISRIRNVSRYYERQKAYYTAISGFEVIKTIISKDPNWFTDIIDGGSASWAINNAIGTTDSFDGGQYKLVRIANKKIVYVVANNRGAVSVIKATFSLSPFKTTSVLIL